MRPRYLRISVTSRCNLNCVYCRPRGMQYRPDVLQEFRPREIATLARCAAAEGVRKVRITGGEPLVRGDLEDIVRAVSRTPGITETDLTTNAIGLASRALELKKAGLGRVNISLDTLRPERFVAITGHDRLQDVLAGITAAAELFRPVKLNTVLMPGVNDDEIEALVAFAARRGLWIRFIERYGARGSGSAPCKYVPAEEIKKRLRDAFGVLRRVQCSALSVEETYVLPSAGGAKVGVIASVSHPPCAACSRLRFTASGELLSCLFASSGIDVLALVGKNDTAGIRAAIRKAFALKDRRGAGRAPAVSVPISHVGG